MAFDAGMLAASVNEIRNVSVGGRVDRIAQPSRDEVVLTLRCAGEGAVKILINSGSNYPRIGITGAAAENPEKPPMFCVLLRKHLIGSRFVGIRQLGFERAAELEFYGHDELGFPRTVYIITEVMGKYSNLIIADGDRRIISALRVTDFSENNKRQVIVGAKYELPPKQNKADPLCATEDEFLSAFEKTSPDVLGEKFITANYFGISATVAREIVFRATRHVDTPIQFCDAETLCKEFFAVVNRIKENSYEPTLVVNEGRPCEYGFLPLLQYGAAEQKSFRTIGELFDAYFGERDREERTKKRAADLMKFVSNAENRLKKKLELQRAELAECDKGEKLKKTGDLITANIYKIKKGDKKVKLTDYERMNDDGTFAEVEIELDERLSPSANAQKYYKKYAKLKTAKVELSKQIKIGEEELEYFYSVSNALSHAETLADLAEIREELDAVKYASKLQKKQKNQKPHKPVVARFETSGGFTVLCGKNNIQNEYITFKVAEKSDWWFHAKKNQGAHVVMLCGDREPDDNDFVEAAEIAAYYSRAEANEKTEVDYTKAGNVKKPSGCKPGYVIYRSNFSCMVTPDPDKISKMRKNK